MAKGEKEEGVMPGKTIHGGSYLPEYTAWISMRRRCYDVKNASYASYGGRGIKVCEEWDNSFERFFLDVGPRPKKGMSLDRVNVNGDYKPGNVRWATPKAQSANRRNNRVFFINEERMIAAEIARRIGRSRTCVLNRIKNGCTIDMLMYKGRFSRHHGGIPNGK